MISPNEHVIYEVRNRVGWITINRQEARNSISEGVLAALNHLIDGAAEDAETSAFVISGAGGKAFCAGADMGNTFAGKQSFLEMHEGNGKFAKLLAKMNQCKKPILAAVEGYCLAGGMGLCLSCDLVIASDDSTFGCPEIKRGIWPFIVSALLIRNVGRKKALELCMTGDFISAKEAERIGMINRVVPKGEFRSRVEEMAEKLASYSPATMGLGKSSFYQIGDMEFDAALEFLKSQLTINTQLEDLKEGITAFMEKRTPVWKGR
jgi:enoyl-CoA hydratase